jgi:hypothetical protein
MQPYLGEVPDSEQSVLLELKHCGPNVCFQRQVAGEATQSEEAYLLSISVLFVAYQYS